MSRTVLEGARGESPLVYLPSPRTGSEVPVHSGPPLRISVKKMFHVLEIGRSSRLGSRPLSKLEIDDTDIKEKISRIFKESDSTYGHRRIKKDLIHRRRFSTRSQATLAMVNYIVSWYNPKRILGALGGLSPMEFEQEYYARLDH